MTLEKHPIVNAAYDPSGAIKYNDDINVAMAVALDGGLITPTIRKVNWWCQSQHWRAEHLPTNLRWALVLSVVYTFIQCSTVWNFDFSDLVHTYY